MAIISRDQRWLGDMTARVCSRSLVVFNPLLVNLPPSSHDGGTSSWIQLPHFFCSDLSLILLSLLRRAHCHVNLRQAHGQKRINGQLAERTSLLKWDQVNHTQGPAEIENLPDKKFRGNWCHYLPQSLVKCSVIWVQQKQL